MSTAALEPKDMEWLDKGVWASNGVTGTRPFIPSGICANIVPVRPAPMSGRVSFESNPTMCLSLLC